MQRKPLVVSVALNMLLLATCVFLLARQPRIRGWLSRTIRQTSDKTHSAQPIEPLVDVPSPTTSAAPFLVDANYADICYSGGGGGGSNWAVIKGSLLSINPGAEVGINLRRRTNVSLVVYLGSLVSAKFPASSFPAIKYSLDGGPAVHRQLLESDDTISLGTAAASVRVWLESLDPYGGNPDGRPLATKWSGKNSLIVRGFLVDPGSVGPKPPHRKQWLAFGDSITEGEWEKGDSSGNLRRAVESGDATASYGAIAADAIGYEAVNCSFGGSDYEGTMNSDVPELADTFDRIYAGAKRLVTSPPEIWSVNLGANGRTTTSDSVTKALLGIRRMVGPDSRGFLMVPFGGQKRELIVAAFAQFKKSWPTDNLRLIDLHDQRFLGKYGVPTFFTTDGLHPNIQGQSLLGAMVAARVTDP